MTNHSTSAADSRTIAWVASLSILTLFLLMCYVASASAAWPHARPRIPLWFFVFAVLFPPIFPFLLLFLFVIPPAPLVVYGTESVPPSSTTTQTVRAERVVVIQQPIRTPRI